MSNPNQLPIDDVVRDLGTKAKHAEFMDKAFGLRYNAKPKIYISSVPGKYNYRKFHFSGKDCTMIEFQEGGLTKSVIVIFNGNRGRSFFKRYVDAEIAVADYLSEGSNG